MQLPCKHDPVDPQGSGLGYLEWYPNHRVYHPGVDFNNGSENDDLATPCYAAQKGIVEHVSPEPTEENKFNGGFGLHLVLHHEELKRWTHYVHLNKVTVKKDQAVKKGEPLGEIGKSGTTYAHLHFEVWTPELHKIQAAHWRLYAWYPTNLPKHRVKKLYANPLDFIHATAPSKEAAQEYPLAGHAFVTDRDHGGIQISTGRRMSDPTTRAEVWEMLRRYHEKYHSKE